MSINTTINLNKNIASLRLNSGARYASNKRFPAGYFVSQVMPLTAIRPAPDSQVTGYYTPDHYGYVGRETQIRICVQGGAYPYVPAIETAPTGTLLGDDPLQPNYMVLRYTPTTNGVYSFRVRVFDQHGNSVLFAWTFTVSQSWCVFCDPTGNDTTGDGTFANPWATITKAINTTQGLGGKTVILKDGTYTDHPGGLNVNSLIAWNQRGAIVDLASSTTTTNVQFYMNYRHTTIQGIVFRNPPTTCNDPRWFSMDNTASYICQDNCRFEINGRQGLLNGDNVSCFFLGNTGGTTRKYISQTRCEFDGFKSVGNGWSAIDTYTTEFFVIEDNFHTNQITGNASSGVIWIKGSGSRSGDVRRNTFDSTFTNLVIDCSISASSALVSGNIDISYNVIKGSGTISLHRGTGDYARLPVWSRRNTVNEGAVTIYNWMTYTTNVTSDSDVIQSSTVVTTDPWKVFYRSTNQPPYIRPLTDTANLTYSIVNYECHLNSGVIDANGNLIGVHRTNFLGRRGHEIYKP